MVYFAYLEGLFVGFTVLNRGITSGALFAHFGTKSCS